MNLRMGLEELFDLPRLVGGEIVRDDVDLFAARLVDDDIGDEGDELRRAVPRRGLTQHLSGLGIERRVKRERSMPVVLKAMSLRSSRRERQYRIESIESVNSGLFIDAEHCAMLRRMQVQGDDVGRLFLKVRIVRGHVPIEPMRLEAVLAPHARDHHVRHAELIGQLTRAPVRCSARLALDRPLQDACLELRRERARLLSRVATEKPCEPLGDESLAPAIDERIIARELLANLGPGLAGLEQQNQPGAPGVVGSPCLARCSLAQLHAFRLRKTDCVAHEHNHTPFLYVTVH